MLLYQKHMSENFSSQKIIHERSLNWTTLLGTTKPIFTFFFNLGLPQNQKVVIFINICIWYWLECEMGLSQHKCLNPARAWKVRAGFGYECWDNPSSTKTNTICIFSHVTSILSMFRILLWADLWHVYRDRRGSRGGGGGPSPPPFSGENMSGPKTTNTEKKIKIGQPWSKIQAKTYPKTH